MQIEIKITTDINELVQEPNPFDCFIKADMTDKTVHDWFALFERVLQVCGYNEGLVMRGACELAFNEWRKSEDMVQVAKEYDLTLNEFSHQNETINPEGITN